MKLWICFVLYMLMREMYYIQKQLTKKCHIMNLVLLMQKYFS